MSNFRKKSKSLLEILKFFYRAIMPPEVQFCIHVLNGLFPVPLMSSPVAIVKMDFFPILKLVFLFSCQYAFGDVFGPGKVRRAAYGCFWPLVTLFQSIGFILAAWPASTLEVN